MPFAFVFVGLVLVLTGIQDTYTQLGSQLRKDFNSGFSMWVLAILLIGSLGYIEPIRPISKAFLTLIIVAMLIANPKFFTEVQNAVKQGPIAPQKNAPMKQPAGGYTEAQSPPNVTAAKKANDALGAGDSTLTTMFKALGTFFLGAPVF